MITTLEFTVLVLSVFTQVQHFIGISAETVNPTDAAMLSSSVSDLSDQTWNSSATTSSTTNTSMVTAASTSTSTMLTALMPTINSSSTPSTTAASAPTTSSTSTSTTTTATTSTSTTSSTSTSTTTTTTSMPTTSQPAPLPPKPVNLTVANSSADSLTITWQGTSNVSCTVTYSKSGSNTNNSTCSNVTNMTCQITRLEPGSSYNITVISQLGDKSNSSDLLIGITNPRMNSPCNTSNFTSSSMILSWPTANASLTVTYFYTYNYTTNQMLTNTSATSANILGLTPGFQYFFEVQASVNGITSNTVTCVGATGPDAPTNILVSNISSTSLTVAWSPGQTRVINSTVVSYTCGSQNKTNPANNNSTILTSLTSGCNYTICILITSYNKVASSCVWNTTNPDAPTNILVSNINSTSLTVAWSRGQTNNISSTVVSYICGSVSQNKTTPANDISTVLTNLTSGCNYTICISITSYNKRASSCSSTRTNPYINGNCSCSQQTNSSIYVTWPLASSVMNVSYFLKYPLSDSQQCFTNSLNVMGLAAGEAYPFTIYAQLQDDSARRSPNITCSCSTIPNTPLGLSLLALNETSFMASWKTDANASMVLFNVTYSQYESGANFRVASCDSRESSCVITVSPPDLAGSSYNVCLSSVSNSLRSPEECHGVATYPFAPSNVTTFPTSNSINLTVTPNSRNINSTRLYYIAILTDSNGLDIYQWMTDWRKTIISFSGLNPASNYTYSVKSAVNGSCSVPATRLCDHESLTNYSGVVSTGESTPTAPQNLSVVSDNGSGDIVLSWLPPLNRNGVLLLYTIRYSRVKTKESQVLDAVQEKKPSASCPNDYCQYSLSDLKAGYFYNIQVFASTIVGEGEKISRNHTTKQSYPILMPPFKNFTLTTLSDRSVSFERLKAILSNVFNNRTGDIVNYTLIVTTVSDFNTSTDINSILMGQFPAHAAKKNDNEFFCKDGTSCTVEIGTDGSCRENSGTVCDAKLKPEMTYYFYLLACNSEYCSSSAISQSGKTDINWPLLIMKICVGVLVPVGVIALIVLVVLIVCFVRRKGPRKSSVPGLTSPTENSEPISSCIGKPIPVEQFLERVAELERDSGLLYTDEYEELKPVGKEQSCSCSELEPNRTKNRYGNIKPYDITRVKLLPIEDEEGSDYINANWMPGFNSKREFIAAQGPLPCTKDDFWRMVWEYNCRGIVMLTGCVENGKIKCDQYWPQDMEPVVYGDLQVTKTKEETISQWVVRDLTIRMGQQQRNLSHVHLPFWEDNTGPGDVSKFIQFVRFVQSKLTKRGGPVVVHCSAGVGRTGTFIAVDTLLQQLDRQNFLDVFEVVYKLRLNRVCMVQTEAQYVSLYRCMAYEIENRSTQPEETQEETYANFNGGPQKREDDIYANANGVFNREVTELNGQFFYTGPESS